MYNFRGDLIREIIRRGYNVSVTGPDETGTDEIRRTGARLKVIPLDKAGVNVFADLRYLYRLFRFLRREKPEATLGYTIKPVIYGGIAAKLAGVKNINSMVTGAGYLFTAKTVKARLLLFFVRFLYRIGLKCADTVIFQNPDDMKEFIDGRLVEKSRCRLVNGSGVNMEKFTPSEFPEKVTFFMLSRILRSKGVLEYLEAAEKVKTKHPEIRCILLGAVEDLQDSIPFAQLQPYIEGGFIEYFGETPDVSDYYRQSSVYVLPSYREGTPRTVLEAMAMGRPVITTNTNGCRETVIDGKNGFLVPIQDADALAGKMEWFVENRPMIRIMGKESLALCMERFDVMKVNAEMMKHMRL